MGYFKSSSIGYAAAGLKASDARITAQFNNRQNEADSVEFDDGEEEGNSQPKNINQTFEVPEQDEKKRKRKR